MSSSAPLRGRLFVRPARLPVVASAMLLCLAAPVLTAKAHAMKIQQIKSPGGIDAWLVQEHAVPLIALRFVFEGGSSQNPAGKEGLANFLSAMMDEGAGDLDSHKFQERMEELAFRMSFEVGASIPPGTFAEQCEAQDALTLEIALRAEQDGGTEVIRSASYPVALGGRELILPTTFSTGGVVEHPAMLFGEPPLEVLPTDDRELIVNWGGGRPLYRHANRLCRNHRGTDKRPCITEREPPCRPRYAPRSGEMPSPSLRGRRLPPPWPGACPR